MDRLSFRFGDFRLIPSERLLLRGNAPVPLTGKAFDLLLVLARRSGELVNKDELLREVWLGRLVEEVNLSVTVAAIRKALGPVGASMIQTVSRHGYRLVAPAIATDTPAVGTLDCTTGIARSHPPTRAFARDSDPVPGGLNTRSPDAGRAYVEGRYAWSKRSEPGLRTAIGHFERAVSLDPDFAAAHAGLADCFATLGYLSFLSPTEAFPLARRHALSAIARDRGLAEPYASLGYVKFYFDWDWPGAKTEFEQAITLDPGWAAGHQWYSIFLLATGDVASARAQIELARARDPLSLAIATDLGFHHYYARQYDDAVKQLQSVLAMNPDFAPAHLWLGRSYEQLGWFDQAIAEFRLVEGLVPDWPVAIAARAHVEGAAGRLDQSRAALAELRALAKDRFVTPYGLALVHAALGDIETTLTWLNRALAERSHWLVWLRLDPRFDGLRADQRFSELLDRVHFPRQDRYTDQAAPLGY